MALHHTLELFRRDRRNLMEFLLSPSTGLIKELRNPTGPIASLSGIDFDSLSCDYIIQSLKSGGVVDISEATKKYAEESPYPTLAQSQLGTTTTTTTTTYFLLSDPKLSGSPPRRQPPSVDFSEVPKSTFYSAKQPDPPVKEISTASNNDISVECNYVERVEDVEIPSLGLPCLRTGLSDDDLRESAYEILLASMASSGIEIDEVGDRKKAKTPKFFSVLRNKRDGVQQRSSLKKMSGLICTIRAQMQISGEMDLCIRRVLSQLNERRELENIDIAQISLGLLKGVFKSDISKKSYLRWKNRQASLLEELLHCSVEFEKYENEAISTSLGKIRNGKEWDIAVSPSSRAEILSALRSSAHKLSSFPAKIGVTGETFYWTSGYHLNIRLYETLLVSVFDILDEAQVLLEADDVMKHIKLTWSILGITQKIHNVLNVWVLFKQYLKTNEAKLLEYAILEIQKVKSTDYDNEKEEQYINNLACFGHCNGKEMKMSLVEAVFFTISIWIDQKLGDYHLHFGQKPNIFRMVANLLSAVGILTSDDNGDVKLVRLNVLHRSAVNKIKFYVECSAEAAYRRITQIADLESKMQKAHPLVLLANEVRLIAQIEFNIFCPVLCRWNTECGMIAARLWHRSYGERLELFLSNVSHLTQDVMLVMTTANLLDHDLSLLFAYKCKGKGFHQSINRHLDHYPIGEVAKPFVLDWVIAQSMHVLEWTRRAFDLEDWEPLSSLQKQATSIVEVFRIVEETVDQFFRLNLPMDLTHLQALLSLVFHSLDAYLQKLLNQLVDKKHLYPPAPALTRYKESSIPVLKKTFLKCVILDENISLKLNDLTIAKLCIRLNTLKYIEKQIGSLEDSIKKSWISVGSLANQRLADKPLECLEGRNSLTLDEAVDSLFANTFNVIRDMTADTTRKLCEFIGARVVFWDLRDPFILGLYHRNVVRSRLDSIFQELNKELELVCCLIDDALRQLVVKSIYQASMEGLVWVLLDGGPSRAFSDSDILMIEDDLNQLKEFFVAEGEGLPQTLVEDGAKLAQHIVSLYSMKTETVIRMLMNVSEEISMGSDQYTYGCMEFEDSQILIRVLCHKKDREASKFLEKLYQLPMSSEYDDMPVENTTSVSPSVSVLLKRSTSLHWAKGQNSFRSFRKQLRKASSGIWSSTSRDDCDPGRDAQL